MEITAAMVKPVYSTPHPLAGEKVPLTVFDRAALDLLVPTVFAYPAPAPSNEALKEGLRKALAPYTLTSRAASPSTTGAAAALSADLSDVISNGMPAGNVDKLYPTLPEENVGAALLQIKLNRCKCGGLKEETPARD
ncbi:uncharacterized protein C2845_PM02G35240 [Panicum miliaceum]|uniref:Uncharacterized protein n=1 Tax=Panicum miliaceum TaxID=4540 RepID=A0A3L6SF50_PANMI|nr:uncharacterized protein C2845_PM02G35240 [Panicum miliaceum]